MKKIMSVEMRAALDQALPDICQFLELIASRYSDVQNEVLDEMDLDDDAFEESKEALHAIIDYKKGETYADADESDE